MQNKSFILKTTHLLSLGMSWGPPVFGDLGPRLFVQLVPETSHSEMQLKDQQSSIN